jgi:hypothetical protein
MVEASFVDVPDMQEDQIIHDAAKVLRGYLHAVKIFKDVYPSQSDLSHHRSLQFMHQRRFHTKKMTKSISQFQVLKRQKNENN